MQIRLYETKSEHVKDSYKLSIKSKIPINKQFTTNKNNVCLLINSAARERIEFYLTYLIKQWLSAHSLKNSPEISSENMDV